MTDNEIIGGLERKAKAICDVCDTKENCYGCLFGYVNQALALITRQKAEIESLESDLKTAGATILNLYSAMVNMAPLFRDRRKE